MSELAVLEEQKVTPFWQQRVLFVENNDSFSWNVVETLPFAREQVTLVSPARLAASPELLDEACAVVMGPGPTDPERAGLCALVHRVCERELPLLGICLGMQAIGAALGARLTRTRPVHGKTSRVELSGSRLFAPRSFAAMRYHSLSLGDVIAPLHVVAHTRDGIPMAIEHRSLPVAGLQFHPDSFATPEGPAIVGEFFSRVLGARTRVVATAVA